MRVAFAGSPAAAATVLDHLVSTRHRLALVITQPDRSRGRSSRLVPTAVAEAAEEHGIPVLKPTSINDEFVLAAMREADLGALAVAAFGQILREPLLSEWLCLNVHFSLLPKYRGAAPVERAIMDGVSRTGVTIMRMDEGLDTGPIALAASVEIGPDDDAMGLTGRLAGVGGPLLADTLDAAEDGSLSLAPQPEEGVSYAAKITAEDRSLNPERPARAVVDHVRALAPHVGATIVIGGHALKVWAAKVHDGDRLARPVEARDGRLLVRCADGAVELLQVQPPGRGRMGADAFLRGWRGDLTPGA